LEKAAKEGLTPLEVILRAMGNHAKARRWDKAAAFAKDAAPYLHAKPTAKLELTGAVRQIVIEEVVDNNSGAPASGNANPAAPGTTGVPPK
jgi:hypothetical protein